MHVLYLHQHFSTPEGSTGTRSYHFARTLVERGHRVTLVCGSYDVARTGLSGNAVHGYRRGNVDGFEVIEIALKCSNSDSFLKRTLTFVRFALRTVRIAWKTDYDVLFATSTPLTAGIPGIVMRSFGSKRPFVFEVRDLWPELPREMGVITSPLLLKAMSALEWLSYRSATACIGLSPGIVRGIQRRSAPTATVEMISNGCDLDLFTPSSGDRPPGPLRAVFTGAHGIANGLDAVLNVAAELKSRGRDDIEIHFIGTGGLKTQLRQRARRSALDNCIFHETLPKTALAEQLRTYDVGLMILANVPAFYYGTSPNKFFDYLSAGMPVLNNYPGWLADLIQEHDCGIAVPPSDPSAFADALIRFADDPDARTQKGQNARALAEVSFGRAILSNRFADFLELFADKGRR